MTSDARGLYVINCTCGWSTAVFAAKHHAEDAYDDHVRSAHPAPRPKSAYDPTPRFPVTHDGRTVAWCVDEETQTFLQSVLDGDVWDAKEIRALAEQYRSGRA